MYECRKELGEHRKCRMAGNRKPHGFQKGRAILLTYSANDFRNPDYVRSYATSEKPLRHGRKA